MICLTLAHKTIDECVSDVRMNRQYIDLCELRVDFLCDEDRERAYLFPSLVDVPVILTVRRKEDGGAYSASERSRKELILRCLDGDFAYVDIESDIKKGDVEEKAKKKGVKIIRSLHDFSGVPSDIYSKIYNLSQKGGIAKVCLYLNSFSDVLTLFRIQEELKGVDKIVIGMGPYGVCTRILYHFLGSILTFASSNEAAPGQLSAAELKNIYRADKINDRTAIYGIIGNPVSHSFSPVIHNQGFKTIKYNAVYVPFLVDNIRAFFSLAETLKIRGFSVTIPFKNEVLSFLGNVTREVKQIGSCNTVVRVPGMWKGINTDYYGFIAPVLPEIESSRIKSALVIGAGGASKAIVWALRNYGVKVIILNRTLEKAEDLARMNFCQYDSLDNISKYSKTADLIVQTTPSGMVPYEDENPAEGYVFSGNEIAYDIVYKPKMTKFLIEAEKAGCTLKFGSQMLIEQGKLQFEAFTGYHYPQSIILDEE